MLFLLLLLLWLILYYVIAYVRLYVYYFYCCYFWAGVYYNYCLLSVAMLIDAVVVVIIVRETLARTTYPPDVNFIWVNRTRLFHERRSRFISIEGNNFLLPVLDRLQCFHVNFTFKHQPSDTSRTGPQVSIKANTECRNKDYQSSFLVLSRRFVNVLQEASLADFKNGNLQNLPTNTLQMDNIKFRQSLSFSFWII